jgi:hypothetical protein
VGPRGGARHRNEHEVSEPAACGGLHGVVAKNGTHRPDTREQSSAVTHSEVERNEPAVPLPDSIMPAPPQQGGMEDKLIHD